MNFRYANTEYIEIVVDGNIKRVGITRIHMEEDAGKNIHEAAWVFTVL